MLQRSFIENFGTTTTNLDVLSNLTSTEVISRKFWDLNYKIGCAFKSQRYKGHLEKILGPQLQNSMHLQILLLQRSFTEYFGTTATKLNALSNYTIKGHLQKLCDHKYKIRCNFFFLISLVESHLKYCISGWPAERLLALPGPFTSDRSLF